MADTTSTASSPTAPAASTPPGCTTCGKKKEDEYRDGGWHNGGSSAGVDAAQTPMSDSARFVGNGGPSVTARDGGWHFGGSSAGPDTVYQSGAETLHGYYDGYQGVLEQHSQPDCMNIATANALAEQNGLSGEDAQRMVMNVEAQNGVPNNSQFTGPQQFGYTNVSVDNGQTLDLNRLASQPDRAMQVGMLSPDNWTNTGSQLQSSAAQARLDGDYAIAGRIDQRAGLYNDYGNYVQQNQAAVGVQLAGADGAHALTIDRVYTGADGGQMLSVSNPHGQTFQIPANNLQAAGAYYITYGDAPKR